MATLTAANLSIAPFYSHIGDFLTVHLSDETANAERVDDTLTVFRSAATDEIVGCKMKGVSLLAQNVQNIIQIEDGEICLTLLLLNAAGPNSENSERYYDLSRRVQQVKIPLEMLRAA